MNDAGRRVAIGIGARAGVEPEAMMGAVVAVLRQEWTLVILASIDRRAESVAAVALSMGVESTTFSAAELSAVATPSVSQRVFAAVGSASVAEASALLAAGSDELLVHKIVHLDVTVAVASYRSAETEAIVDR